MDNRVYWIWMQHALRAGSTKPGRIFKRYGSARAFYESGRESWLLDGMFTQRELEHLSSFSLDQAQAQLETVLKLGQSVLCLDDPAYPVLLREISSPPCVLYYKGELPPADALCIAMVGTRNASPDGLAAANLLSYGLAEQGAVVVSGGAVGIDSACHKGALRAGGTTVCVLGCSIDYPYLMRNASLREAISHNGVLLSEYPPQTPPFSRSFPIRNRILSGLSVGTVVVEAAAKSGTMITVNAALDQGRDVFAVPGSVMNAAAQGVNRLIREGAKPVTCAQDILDEYPGRLTPVPHHPAEQENFNLPPAEQPKEQRVKALPEEESAVQESIDLSELSTQGAALLSAMEKEPRHIAELAKKAGLPVSLALSAATELELLRLARSCSGGRYQKL